MSYFKVFQGIYYAISGAHIITSWLSDDYDVAQNDNPAAKVDTDTGYGFLGFQAGLKVSQRVDEALWETRIPWEVHLKRHTHPDWRQNEHTQQAHDIYIRNEIRFYIEVEYFNGPTPITTRSIEFIGKSDFEEVIIPQMEAQNQASTGTSFQILDSTNINAQTTPIPAAENHPKYFHIITPPNSVGVLTPLKLGYIAKMKPGPGMTRKQLAYWFNPIDPNSVRSVRTADNPIEQIIDYDY